MSYFLPMQAQKNNIFAKIIRGEIPCEKVLETDNLIAIHDVNPQAPVHVLIIPKLDILNLCDTAPGMELLLGSLLLAADQVAKILEVKESGYRVVINTGKDGGQTVDHLHVHLLAGRTFAWPPG